MPRTEAANQRVREEQRGRILDGARTVFARRGLAATMAEVAVAAGVSQGLAYRYFANKDELFRALVAEAVQTEGPPQEWPDRPGERIAVLLSRLLAVRRERPEFFQLVDHVMSDPSTPADLVRMVERRGRYFTTELRRMIVEGQAAGEVAEGDPDQLVSVFVACIDGLSRFAQRSPEHARRHFPDAEILMRMLRPAAAERNP
ncbi:MAG TPA: helix-turn-helix domain-containing protein [Candidatus Dormibacteraeota bacterium]